MKLEKVIIRPLITEKSMGGTSFGQFAFQVDRQATKRQIAQAVKHLFKVDPVKVQTMRVKGKTRRSLRTRKESRLPDWKKALVTLKEGQKIDLFEVTEK